MKEERQNLLNIEELSKLINVKKVGDLQPCLPQGDPVYENRQQIAIFKRND
jgi:hypothetical protein